MQKAPSGKAFFYFQLILTLQYSIQQKKGKNFVHRKALKRPTLLNLEPGTTTGFERKKV